MVWFNSLKLLYCLLPKIKTKTMLGLLLACLFLVLSLLTLDNSFQPERQQDVVTVVFAGMHSWDEAHQMGFSEPGHTIHSFRAFKFSTLLERVTGQEEHTQIPDPEPDTEILSTLDGNKITISLTISFDFEDTKTNQRSIPEYKVIGKSSYEFGDKIPVEGILALEIHVEELVYVPLQLQDWVASHISVAGGLIFSEAGSLADPIENLEVFELTRDEPQPIYIDERVPQQGLEVVQWSCPRELAPFPLVTTVAFGR